MHIYSKKIIKFIEEIRSFIKICLSGEIGLNVYRERFDNSSRTCSYPINIVIFNNKSRLGHFDSHFLELGFHERLMHVDRKQLHDIIRHELAHYMVYINFGSTGQPHGYEFKAFCNSVGWGEEVYGATICLGNDESQLFNQLEEENGILRKVQKLMALSTSSNQNESEQAMIKAQQMLLKHNIDSKYAEEDVDERFVMKRIMKQNKENAKMRAIAAILKTFLVTPVYSRHEGCVYLEIVGTAINIEIAEYVTAVLEVDLDRLWEQARKQHQHLKGLMAKNSFFWGIAKGYCDKIDKLQNQYQGELSRSLMVIEKKLMDARDMVYPRLSTRRCSGGYCEESSQLGQMAGNQLNINPALQQGQRGYQGSKKSELLLIH